ncbi:hypothetical protein PVAG01_01346 [Phlyctema vagabunda]|uniref:Uncharacterized protein n=1 Tax=Phlyctema vagabunda TaxID=108571 RepID=A0ABR4PXG0_9HELO
MAPRKPGAKDREEDSTYLGDVGPMPCWACKLRGNGITDANSNWRLWNADMKIFRDGKGTVDEDEVFASKDEEILTKMERRRKAILWFSISEKLREEHLVDLGGRDKTSEDVLKRIHERVAPPGTPYQPLGALVVTDEIREGMKEVERKMALKKEKDLQDDVSVPE